MRSRLVILFLVCSQLANAQWSGDRIGIGVLPGYLLAHRADLSHLQSHLVGIEVNYEKHQFDGDWAKHYQEPVLGYGITYSQFSNKMAGNTLALHSNFRYGLITYKKFKFRMRLSAGLGIVTKKFDPFTNRRNQAIGSHLNAYMQSIFLFDIPVSKGELEFGVAVSHYSNAAYAAPNLGYNMPSFNIHYGIGSKPAEYSRSPKTSFEKKNHLTLNTVMGVKERNFAKPVRFVPYGLMIRGLRQSSEIRAWRLGFDVIIDKSYLYQLDNQVDLVNLRTADKLEIGMAGGHEWRVGDLRMLLELGAYVYKPAAFKNAIYQRMGFRYEFSDNFGAHGTLKFHSGVADYMEWGLVYKLSL